jgi:hypothetical protein
MRMVHSFVDQHHRRMRVPPSPDAPKEKLTRPKKVHHVVELNRRTILCQRSSSAR